MILVRFNKSLEKMSTTKKTLILFTARIDHLNVKLLPHGNEFEPFVRSYLLLFAR